MNFNHMDVLANSTGNNMNVMTERLMQIINKIDVANISVLLDIGSTDAWEGINLARVFHDAQVYAFEPVRYNYEQCISNVSKQDPDVQSRIVLQQLALNDTTGPMQFWELDEIVAAKKGKLNRSIGSKYQLLDPDMKKWEHNRQRAVNVMGCRLDDWCTAANVSKIDGIWLDARGAELDVLKGAGTILDRVQFIITKAGMIPVYHGHNMKADIDYYLESKGFIEWSPARRNSHTAEANVIYLNIRTTKF